MSTSHNAVSSARSGFPSVAQDYFYRDFSFDDHIITSPETSFGMRVSGSAMIPVGIFNGDIAIVDTRLTPEKGDIVVISLDGAFHLRQLDHTPEGIPVLVHINTHHTMNYLYFDSRVEIWGVVIGTYHPQRKPALSPTSEAYDNAI